MDPKWAYDQNNCNDDGYWFCRADPQPNGTLRTVVTPGRRQIEELNRGIGYPQGVDTPEERLAFSLQSNPGFRGVSADVSGSVSPDQLPHGTLPRGENTTTGPGMVPDAMAAAGLICEMQAECAMVSARQVAPSQTLSVEDLGRATIGDVGIPLGFTLGGVQGWAFVTEAPKWVAAGSLASVVGGAIAFGEFVSWAFDGRSYEAVAVSTWSIGTYDSDGNLLSTTEVVVVTNYSWSSARGKSQSGMEPVDDAMGTAMYVASSEVV